MEEILVAKARVSDSYVFPAKGLTLVAVDYPSREELLQWEKRVPSTLIDLADEDF
jgi:hypothetical protein